MQHFPGAMAGSQRGLMSCPATSAKCNREYGYRLREQLELIFFLFGEAVWVRSHVFSGGELGSEHVILLVGLE